MQSVAGGKCGKTGNIWRRDRRMELINKSCSTLSKSVWHSDGTKVPNRKQKHRVKISVKFIAKLRLSLRVPWVAFYSTWQLKWPSCRNPSQAKSALTFGTLIGWLPTLAARSFNWIRKVQSKNVFSLSFAFAVRACCIIGFIKIWMANVKCLSLVSFTLWKFNLQLMNISCSQNALHNFHFSVKPTFGRFGRAYT